MQNASEAGAEPTAPAPGSSQAQVAPREAAASEPVHQPVHQSPPQKPIELGGPAGPEPTRFGDWERKGRCIDF